MAQVIDFVAKKKELESKKKKVAQPAHPKTSAEVSSINKEPPTIQKAASESNQEQEDKTSYDFDKIMKDNASRKDHMNQKRFKDNESVKRSYRLKSKREPQT